MTCFTKLPNSFRFIFIYSALIFSTFLFSSTTSAAPCIAPFNAGTIEMPPACDYLSDTDWQIINGLPAGTTIDIAVTLKSFNAIVENAGGSLGGTASTFNATLDLLMSGTGTLAGFNRNIFIGMSGEIHSAAKSPGDANQDFDTKFLAMQASIFGDPDFDLITIKFLDSLGHTNLSQIGGPGTDFYVDSFFDLTYDISFTGAPGSVLEDFSGSTRSEGRIQTEIAIPEPATMAILALGLLYLLMGKKYKECES